MNKDEVKVGNSLDQDQRLVDEMSSEAPGGLWPNESWTSADWESFFTDEDDEEERPPRFPRWISSVLVFLVLVGFIIISLPVVSPRLFDNMDYLNQNIELSHEPMVEKARQAVVGVAVAGRQLGNQRTGTGFCVSEDGWILTNMHVVKDAQSIKVTLENGEVYYTTEYRQLNSYDMVALKIKANALPCLHISKGFEVEPGDYLTIVGNPLGFMRIAVRGPVLALHKYNPADQGGMLEMAAEIRPGSSGSPIMDSNGEAIGIIFGLREGTVGKRRVISALGLTLDLVMDELVALGIVE